MFVIQYIRKMFGAREGAILILAIICFPRNEAGQVVYQKPKIQSLYIHSDIKYRFATTTVSSRLKNTYSKSTEAVLDVTLPNEAFITNLTLEIDGKIITGEIKEKEAARKQYVAAQRRGESAGYIGTKHRETNKFSLTVTVAPQSKVSFNLTYQELLKRKHAHYEQVIYIDPGQPVVDMDITVDILESREITDLTVPPLRNDVNANIADVNTITVITTPTPNTAHVKFVPSVEYQTAQSASGMAGQFVVQYDVERDMDIGDIMVVNGYFVHFFAPEGFQPIPNDVLFILDTSGSMVGTKMNQLKDAMRSILGQLNEGDRMNIMTFSGSTSFWKTEMVDIMDEDLMEEAKTHISSIKASGWTNIELALVAGVTFLRGRTIVDDAVRSPVVVFLTDGEATNGVTDREQILKNVQAINEGFDIPVFSLAFGQYADYDLVKKISIQNNGLGRKIYEASDAAMQITGFYNEIAVTLLNNITFQYLDAPVTNITKHTYTNYFNGSEMVVSGRVKVLDDINVDFNKMVLRVTSNSLGGSNLVLSGELRNNFIDLSTAENETTNKYFEQITEKVWAYLTIKQLLDKELVASDPEEKESYNRQILELSLEYNFVTPLTSMVVTLPTEDEEMPHADELDHLSPTRRLPADLARPMQRARPMLSASGASRILHDPQPYPSTYQHRFSAPMPQQGQLQTVQSRVPSHVASANSRLVMMKPLGGSVGRGYANVKRKDRRKKQQRKNRRKKTRKDKKQKTGYEFPLQVRFPNMIDSLCFSMYDDGLETGPASYILYADSEKDLKVEVMLEKTLLGKWTKQGSVKELHLSAGGQTVIITNETLASKDVSGKDSLPWEVTFSPEMRLTLDAFNMTITANKAGYLNIVVERSVQHGSLAGNGIIGQIMSKKMQLKKIKPKVNRRNKRRRSKELAVLKIVQEGVPLIKRTLGLASTGADECWSMTLKENKVVDMSAAKSM